MSLIGKWEEKALGFLSGVVFFFLIERDLLANLTSDKAPECSLWEVGRGR